MEKNGLSAYYWGHDCHHKGRLISPQIKRARDLTAVFENGVKRPRRTLGKIKKRDDVHLGHFVNPGHFAYIERMGLSCLLLTSDAMLLKVMRTGFSAASVDLELRTDAASAIELSSRRHLDGFVIDCDDAYGARDVLTKIRSSRSNRLSVIFVVVNATTATASKAMANFVLTKPVPETQLSGFLDIAVARMEREHRRYFRHQANLPLQLVCNTGGSFAGKIKNVSEGGLALTHFGPSAVEGVVTVQFELPSAQPQTFQAKAAVVWADAYAMGLRFLHIEPGCRSGFEAWLDSLEAQLRFRESIQ